MNSCASGSSSAERATTLADRSGRQRETFEAYRARCLRELEQLRTHGQRDRGWQARLMWQDARLAASTLLDRDLVLAIEKAGPVQPPVGIEDIVAVRAHALRAEAERRERLSGHERIAEAVARRRLAAEQNHPGVGWHATHPDGQAHSDIGSEPQRSGPS